MTEIVFQKSSAFCSDIWRNISKVRTKKKISLVIRERESLFRDAIISSWFSIMYLARNEWIFSVEGWLQSLISKLVWQRIVALFEEDDMRSRNKALACPRSTVHRNKNYKKKWDVNIISVEPYFDLELIIWTFRFQNLRDFYLYKKYSYRQQPLERECCYLHQISFKSL